MLINVVAPRALRVSAESESRQTKGGGRRLHLLRLQLALALPDASSAERMQRRDDTGASVLVRRCGAHVVTLDGNSRDQPYLVLTMSTKPSPASAPAYNTVTIASFVEHYVHHH